jgi:hypothetical protein
VEPQGGTAHDEKLTADIKPLRLSRIAAGENRYACIESRKDRSKIKIYWDSRFTDRRGRRRSLIIEDFAI